MSRSLAANLTSMSTPVIIDRSRLDDTLVIPVVRGAEGTSSRLTAASRVEEVDRH